MPAKFYLSAECQVSDEGQVEQPADDNLVFDVNQQLKAMAASTSKTATDQQQQHWQQTQRRLTVVDRYEKVKVEDVQRYYVQSIG